MGGTTALLIDFENLIIGLEDDKQNDSIFDPELILKLAEDQSRVAIAAAYADWRNKIFNQYQRELYKYGIELIHVLGRGQKNAVDLRLAIDAMEIIYERPQINRFVIVSGDRDFIHLLKKLRLHDKEIIGMAPKSSVSEDFMELCDRFLTYRGLKAAYSKESAEDETQIDKVKLDVFKEQLADLFVRYVGEDGIRGAQIKPLIRRHISQSFDESQFGFSKIIAMMREFSDIVRIKPSEKPGYDFWAYPVGTRIKKNEVKPNQHITIENIVAKARARLSQVSIDWSRPNRDGLLSDLHKNMIEHEPFSFNEIIQIFDSFSFASGEEITRNKLLGYLKVCQQSTIFKYEGDPRGVPFLDKKFRIRKEYKNLNDFVERFEQSILYKIKDLLPDEREKCTIISKTLLQLNGEDEDSYVADLLEKVCV